MAIEFEETFEVDLSQWTTILQGTGTMVIDSLNPKVGSKALHCTTVAGVSAQRQCLSKTFPALAQVKHFRAYFNFLALPPVDSTKRTTVLGSFPNINVPTNYYATISLLGDELVVYYRDKASLYILKTGIHIQANKYYLIEERVKVGNGDGEIKLWLDETEVVNLTGLVNNEWTGIDSMRVGINYSDNDTVNQEVFIDQLAYAPEYIGPYSPVTPPKGYDWLVIGAAVALTILGSGAAAYGLSRYRRGR